MLRKVNRAEDEEAHDVLAANVLLGKDLGVFL